MEDPKKCLAATKKLLEETKLRTALVTLPSLQVRSDALPKLHETIKLKSNTTVAEALKVSFFQQVSEKYVYKKNICLVCSVPIDFYFISLFIFAFISYVVNYHKYLSYFRYSLHITFSVLQLSTLLPMNTSVSLT